MMENKYEDFCVELIGLMKRNSVYLNGVLPIRPLDAGDEHEIEFKSRYTNKWYEGPFLDIGLKQRPIETVLHKSTHAQDYHIFDKDKLFQGGPIQSPVTGKRYANRKEWNDHLKARGLQEVGNDYNRKTEEPSASLGKYDCRPQLEKAVHQTFERRGIKG